MKQLIFSLFITLFAALASVDNVSAQSEPKILIKMATLASKNSAMANVLAKVDKEIRQRSNNEVGLRVYYGGIQGDESEAIQKIKFKQLHGGLFTASGLHRIVPEVHVLSLPFLFRNFEEVSYVRGKIRDELDKRFWDKGYVMLAWGDAGFVYQFSKVRITSAAVARKQKFWQWGDDPVGVAMFNAMGVTPVSLSIADVMTSLSTQLIDAAGSTTTTAVALRWYTKFQYMSDYPQICVQGGAVLRRDEWEKISPATQALIKSLTQQYYDEYVQLQRRDDQKAIGLLKQAGIKIDPIAEAGQEGLAFALDVSRKTREALVGSLYSREFLDKVLALLDEYRRSHPNSAVMKIK